MARADSARRDLDQLASLLRSRRLAAGLTGVELGRRTGFGQPKISKIENGMQVPSVEDVRVLVDVLRPAADAKEQLLELSRRVNSDTAERIVVHPGSRLRRATLLSRLTAKRIVVLSTHLVPDWLQTAAYSVTAAGPLDQRERRAVETSLRQRQMPLRGDSTTFEFLLCEAAVRTRVGSPQLMADQVEHLATVPEKRPNVTVRLIPSDAVLALPPPHGFELYDDARVVLSLVPGAVFIMSESDVKPFQEMAAGAECGAMSPKSSRGFLRRLAQSYRRQAST